MKYIKINSDYNNPILISCPDEEFDELMKGLKIKLKEGMKDVEVIEKPDWLVLDS